MGQTGLSEGRMLGGVDALAATGYLHANYAHSLAEFGNPGSGGWMLEREIRVARGPLPAGQAPPLFPHTGRESSMVH
jgi:hypothetical protein